MGNSRLVKLALVFGRCKIIAAEDSGGYYYGDHFEPYVSNFAYHALVEFHHQHYPVPKLSEYRWRRTNHLWLARLLIRIDKLAQRFYRWRLHRAKCIGVRGLNWWYHCPKCGSKLFYSPRTHPCPSCAESVAVVGNSELTPIIESNHDPYTDYGISPDDEAFDEEPEDDW